MKKTISIVLLIIFSISFFNINVHAIDTKKWDGTVDVSWYDNESKIFYIDTPAKLAGIAALVNGLLDPNVTSDDKIIGDKSLIKATSHENTPITGAAGGSVCATTYTSEIDFSGCTFYITNDLDMGGIYNKSTNTWSGPNWSPIGGKYSLLINSFEDDTLLLDTRFNGSINGQGHKIYNLYCNRYSVKGFPYSQCVGLVGYLGDGDFSNKDYRPTISNISLYGYIYARRMVGGIVGRVGETNNGVIIENCANHCNAESSDSKGLGGIVGAGWGKGEIRNCYNTGNISTTYPSPSGGIVGRNMCMNINNCYNCGYISTNGNNYGRAIGSDDGYLSTYEINNCYYLQNSSDGGGYYSNNNPNAKIEVIEMSKEALTNDLFLSKINVSGDIFSADDNNINNGFPVLAFENSISDQYVNITVVQPKDYGEIQISSNYLLKGSNVSIYSTPQTGFILDYFTVNGNKIPGNYFTVTEDCVISAVFRELRSCKIKINKLSFSTINVIKDGVIQDNNNYINVKDYQLNDNETVFENDIINISASIDTSYNISEDYELSGNYTIITTNTKEISPFRFLVTAKDNIEISISPETQLKEWTSYADTNWYNDQDCTFYISNICELVGLSKIVNSGIDSFENKTIKLNNNINCYLDDYSESNRYFPSIGSSIEYPFKGVFDGNDFSIRNFKGYSKFSNTGLFGYCDEAKIINLNLYGSYNSTHNIAGSIVGYLRNGLIDNCKSYVDISGTVSTGGIAGKVAGNTIISNCINYGNIICNNNYAGGIVSRMSDSSSIVNCINNGKISALGMVGGIVGECSSNNEIIKSINRNNIYSTTTSISDYSTGGVIGIVLSSININECANIGNVFSNTLCSGGIIGKVNYKNCIISNCYNIGNITNYNTAEKTSCGGIVGTYLISGEINNSYSIGEINSNCLLKDEIIGNPGSINKRIINCYSSQDKENLIDLLDKTFTLNFLNNYNYPVLVFETQFLLKGDSDSNTSLEIIDAAYSQKYMSKLINIDEINIYNADYNFNGSVEIDDVTALQKTLAYY